MKYYADYWNESVYAVDSDGRAHGKHQDFDTDEVIEWCFKRKDDSRWMWKENEVCDWVEDMTKDEFDSFGKTWIWNNSPNEEEKIKHSWRNYIKLID